MGRPLKTENASNLYEFWRKTITESLKIYPGELLINLASQEYFKAIDKRKLDKFIITPVFKDTKKARGSMARFIIKNRITAAEDLKSFTEEGYAYSPDNSTDSTPTFIRTEM